MIVISKHVNIFKGKNILNIFLNHIGGLNHSVFEGCLIDEEISWGCSGIALACLGSGLGVCEFYVAYTLNIG